MYGRQLSGLLLVSLHVPCIPVTTSCLIMTALLGIAGAFIANFIGQAVGWYRPGEQAGFIASVIGAIVILTIYSLIRKR